PQLATVAILPRLDISPRGVKLSVAMGDSHSSLQVETMLRLHTHINIDEAAAPTLHAGESKTIKLHICRKFLQSFNVFLSARHQASL
ncbi:hypothetical protein PENTCL1PPCAC_12938, partial [Pristionchus entomophagus]